MKTTLIIFGFLFSLDAICQEDYLLRLNDTTISISLDKNYNFSVNGSDINVFLVQKDTLTYEDGFFSFQYLKGFKVSNVKLEGGIEQIAIMTAEGSGMLIQKYESLDPSSLNDLMLNELTKESINFGYKSNKSTYKKKIKPSYEVEVTKAVLTYKDDVNIYEIASLGLKDSGLMIVTMRMDEKENNQGQKIIDLMWKTIKIN